MVAAYCVLKARAAVGVKVATVPLTEMAPATAEPPCGIKVNVDDVKDVAFIASLNVAATAVFTATLMAPEPGVVELIVGGVGGAAAVVKLQV
jgi:hypothetical protein